MAGGTVAGALAAVLAGAASLALASPDAVFLNPLTVAIGALAVGLLSGALWAAFGAGGRVALYGGVLVAAFVASLALFFVAGSELDGLPNYASPLSALVFLLAGVLTPVFARYLFLLRLSPLLLAAAVGAGFALNAIGAPGHEELTLPPSATATPAVVLQATPATVAAGTPSPVATAAPQGEVLASLPAIWQVAEGSQSTFTVREKLSDLPLPNDAVMETTALSGTLRRNAQSTVQVDVHQLHSDSSRRDRFVREDLFRGISTATFSLDAAPAVPEAFFTGQTVPGTITGTLTLGAKTTPLTVTGEAKYDGGKIYLLAKTAFTWAEVGLRPPNLRGFVQVEDTVNVQVLIAAVPAANP